LPEPAPGPVVIGRVHPNHRPVAIAPEGERIFGEMIEALAARLDDSRVDRNVVARDFLVEIVHGPGARYGDLLERASSPFARAAIANLDPRNGLLEAEFYRDVDPDRFARAKPLLWIWYLFDRTPLAANVALGQRFRAMLGKRLFRRCGERVRIFQDVTFSYGYNLTVEDDCVIHRGVLLDDRGEIVLRRGTSVSDWANVYSHEHSSTDSDDVTLGRTEIGPRARITYHSTVFSGVTVGNNALLGAMGVAAKPIRPGRIALGIPAKDDRVKPGACSECGEPEGCPHEREG
jgi:acetyltransferase-like isoleucine patch superfamily enzyme